MIVRLALTLLVALAGISSVAHAAPVGTGLTQEQEARAAALYGQLKCPVCKNQALAASTTFLAEEMKAQIRDLVRMGATDEEILRHYVQRYGEWILLAPPAVAEVSWRGSCRVYSGSPGCSPPGHGCANVQRNSCRNPLPPRP